MKKEEHESTRISTNLLELNNNKLLFSFVKIRVNSC